MSEQPSTDQPLVLLDTSAILELAIHTLRGASSYPHKFHAAVNARFGSSAQYVCHQISLAELATNRHEEVVQGKAGQRSQAAIAQFCAANRAALLALAGLASDVELDVIPMTPSKDVWKLLTRQRASYSLLRCTRKSGVVPVTAMADHVILALACHLQESGYSVGFASGDREQIGAAVRLGLPILYSKDLDATSGFDWKDCARDESCIRGCVDGISSCPTMFA